MSNHSKTEHATNVRLAKSDHAAVAARQSVNAVPTVSVSAGIGLVAKRPC